jgi:soluble epoxide hydrolase / lipid-phosphate phosphatase
VCAGVVLLSVAYRTAELGLDHLLTLVNRETYPESEHPYGQWAYMKFYEEDPEKADLVFNTYTAKAVKAIFSPTDPATFRTISPTALVMRDGGWFGGNPENLPDIPLEKTLLDEAHFNKLVKSLEKTGFFPGSSYYRNHKLNKAYDDSKKNDGVLEMPVLYVDAKYDRICAATTSPKHMDGMRRCCKNLTVSVIESGHWVHMVAPAEVNAKIAQWLVTSLPEYWPWHSQADGGL